MAAIKRVHEPMDVYRGDVVFVHGLHGNGMTTWHPNGHPEDYWPRILGAELSEIGTWSVWYSIKRTEYLGRGLSVREHAAALMADLASQRIGAERPVVFVCHSLGGIIVEEALRVASESSDTRQQSIPGNTRGVVFLSTPHLGSPLADYFHVIDPLKPVVLRDLRTDNEYLEYLGDWFRQFAASHDVAVQAYYERQRTFLFRIVTRRRGNPRIPGVPMIPVDADHIGISKPGPGSGGEREGASVSVREFIRECLAPPPEPITSHQANLQAFEEPLLVADHPEPWIVGSPQPSHRFVVSNSSDVPARNCRFCLYLSPGYWYSNRKPFLVAPHREAEVRAERVDLAPESKEELASCQDGVLAGLVGEQAGTTWATVCQDLAGRRFRFVRDAGDAQRWHPGEPDVPPWATVLGETP